MLFRSNAGNGKGRPNIAEVAAHGDCDVNTMDVLSLVIISRSRAHPALRVTERWVPLGYLLPFFLGSFRNSFYETRLVLSSDLETWIVTRVFALAEVIRNDGPGSGCCRIFPKKEGMTFTRCCLGLLDSKGQFAASLRRDQHMATPLTLEKHPFQSLPP